MFKDFSKSAFANGCIGHINEKSRPRSDLESYGRIALNSHPTGALIDTGLNVGELYGKITMDNINRYNEMNIMNHTNKTEKNWDSFKRATDIDYSGGDECNIF